MSVDLPDVFKYEWTYIPHIVNSPFYCYSYAFGELLAFALYKEYKEKGKGFVGNIKNILEAGGSENPTQLLKNNGIDITKEGFWQEGFTTIRGWLNELIQIS
jgi:oligoendopeptidase F